MPAVMANPRNPILLSDTAVAARLRVVSATLAAIRDELRGLANLGHKELRELGDTAAALGYDVHQHRARLLNWNAESMSR